MKKRIIVLVLAMCMLLSIGVACTEKKPSSNVQVDPTLPVQDFGGREFRIYAKNDWNSLTFEVFGDSASTDICQQALWYRNTVVEDTYNVYITPVEAQAGMTIQVMQIIDDIQSTLDNYDLAMTYAFDTTPLIVNGHVYNWKNFKYTNLGASWWMNDINDGFTIYDDVYATVGYMNTSTISYTFGMYYNRTQGEIWEAGMTEEIFDTIRDGDWTYDYFYNLVKDVYRDEDDEVGVKSGLDFYGFQAEANVNVDNYHFAWELPTITNDPKKGLSIDSYYNDKLVEATKKIYTLYYESNGSKIYATDSDPLTAQYPASRFKSGKALFTTTWLDKSYRSFRDGMEDQYTILPYPKYDDSQKDYKTGIMNDFNVLVVPTSVQDLDFVSLIVEALNKESKESMYDVYLVKALQEKYTGDDDNIEMINYLLDGRVVDIAFLLSQELDICFLLRWTIKAESDDITTRWNEKESQYQDALESVMENFEKWSDYGKK